MGPQGEEQGITQRTTANTVENERVSRRARRPLANWPSHQLRLPAALCHPHGIRHVVSFCWCGLGRFCARPRRNNEGKGGCTCKSAINEETFTSETDDEAHPQRNRTNRNYGIGQLSRHFAVSSRMKKWGEIVPSLGVEEIPTYFCSIRQLCCPV